MAEMDSRKNKGFTGAQVRDEIAAAAKKDPAGLVLKLLKGSGHPLDRERSDALTQAIARIEAQRRQQPVFIPAKKEKGDNNSLEGRPLPPRPSE
jgi:hypothetical protein